jgi:hypothetical protein
MGPAGPIGPHWRGGGPNPIWRACATQRSWTSCQRSNEGNSSRFGLKWPLYSPALRNDSQDPQKQCDTNNSPEVVAFPECPRFSSVPDSPPRFSFPECPRFPRFCSRFPRFCPLEPRRRRQRPTLAPRRRDRKDFPGKRFRESLRSGLSPVLSHLIVCTPEAGNRVCLARWLFAPGLLFLTGIQSRPMVLLNGPLSFG